MNELGSKLKKKSHKDRGEWIEGQHPEAYRTDMIEGLERGWEAGVNWLLTQLSSTPPGDSSRGSKAPVILTERLLLNAASKFVFHGEDEHGQFKIEVSYGEYEDFEDWVICAKQEPGVPYFLCEGPDGESYWVKEIRDPYTVEYFDTLLGAADRALKLTLAGIVWDHRE